MKSAISFNGLSCEFDPDAMQVWCNGSPVAQDATVIVCEWHADAMRHLSTTLHLAGYRVKPELCPDCLKHYHGERLYRYIERLHFPADCNRI